MDYFRLLNLAREPFSNSPDPEFFYRSTGHAHCLNQLEIALRLGRGLNLVVGPVGTGKTTVCRTIYRQLAADDRMEVHLLLDPAEVADGEFLRELLGRIRGLEGEKPLPADDAACREALRQELFARVVEQERTVVLLVDEAQKLTSRQLETLRELLNYETNDRKLLQIALFAQPEIERLLADNVPDRVNLRLELSPLTLRETARLIRHRLSIAGQPDMAAPIRFSPLALWAVHRTTGGRPRQIVHLCHRLLLQLILRERTLVSWAMVQAAQSGSHPSPKVPNRWRQPRFALAAVLLGVLLPAALAIRPPAAPPKAVQPVAQAQPAPNAVAVAPESEVKTRAAEPVILGSLALSPRETLWTMAGRVYGGCDAGLLKTLLLANTHVADPGNVEVGTQVHLPSLAPESAPGGSYVRVGSFEDLTEAYKLLLSWHRKTKLRLLAVHGPDGELHFDVMAGSFLEAGATAEEVLAGLPAPLAQRATVAAPLGSAQRLLAGMPEQWHRATPPIARHKQDTTPKLGPALAQRK